MRALITGARAPACLEWARALTQAGWVVAVADSVHFPVTRFSRTVERYFRLPEPRDGANAYGIALTKAATAFKADIVLPTCEEAFFVSHQKRRIEAASQVFTSDFALMQQLHDKARFAEFAASLPLQCPPSVRITEPAQLAKFATESSDWVFKPCFSRFAARTLIRPAATVLARIRPSPEDPWVAQKFAEGDEICTFSILHQGQVRAHAAYQPLFRVGRGSGVYFLPVDNPAISNFIAAFGGTTQYTGQVGFDFIVRNDGSVSVLECNPRATSGIHLFGSSRRRLAPTLMPGYAGDCVVMETRPRMVGFAMLAFALPAIRDGATLRAFHEAWRRASDVIAEQDDHFVQPAQLLGLIEIIGRSVSRMRPLLSTATADIEWNGQELGPQP